MESRDEIINEFRYRRVLADYNEARRHLYALVFPEFESLLIVTVKGLQRRLQTNFRGSSSSPWPRPFLGMSSRMFSHRSRNIGISLPGMFSATGTRGNLTIPHSIASMSEKSLIVHGNNVPSA